MEKNILVEGMIKVNLDRKEGEEELRKFLSAGDYSRALRDASEMIRKYDKYGNYENDETHEVVSKIREEFYDIMISHDVDL